MSLHSCLWGAARNTACTMPAHSSASPCQLAYLCICALVCAGVAESVVEWSKQHGVDMVVVGSRGMGAVKSTLMSLVGLGSVSGGCWSGVSLAATTKCCFAQQ